MAKFKIELNKVSNLRDLLQETYDQANSQLKQAQDEMNKLAYSTNLSEESIDGKTRYSKAMNDFLAMKDKAIKTKLDIAKLMSDIIANDGNAKKAIEGGAINTSGTFDIKKIRAIVDKSYNDNKNEETKMIELKK